MRIKIELEKSQNLKIQLVNMLGQVTWMQEEYGIGGENKFSIDGSQWQAGIYALRLITESGEFQQKILVPNL